MNTVKPLLTSYHSSSLDLKNRVVMAPMTRSRADNPELKPTDLIAKYYEQRSSSGLIISEGTNISPIGIGYINVPNIYSQSQIEGWQKVTKVVHTKGGKIFAQLWHVGRISHPDLLEGKLPLAPSSINPDTQSYTINGFQDTVTPKEMTNEDIKETIKDFVQATKNAMIAGFDGVELHAAHSYLFHQFFAKCSNTRTDEYGGSIENRSRFLFDVLDAIKEIADIKKVGVRLSPIWDQKWGIIVDEETVPTYEYIVNRLNDYDLAYLHISGMTGGIQSKDPVKKIFDIAYKYRKLFNGTLIINHGFDFENGNKIIEQGLADLVAFGEPYIANPDLVERFESGAPLNKPDTSTYYTQGEKGYTDYPMIG